MVFNFKYENYLNYFEKHKFLLRINHEVFMDLNNYFKN